MSIITTTVADGKYSVVFNDETGELKALRYGEAWPARNLSGDKFVLALAQEIERLRALVAPVEKLCASEQRTLTEKECFVIEAAYQSGFELLGDNGDVVACTDQALVDFVALRSSDTPRLNWLLPIVTGDSGADDRTMALAVCLAQGLDGREAIDKAMGDAS